jgi:hypothetical protein
MDSESAARVRAALAHRAADRIPVDFGSTFVSGMHVSCVAALREHFSLEPGPVRVIDPGQMLGEIAGDLKQVLGIDTEPLFRRSTKFGFPLEDWKPFRMDDGLEVLVPGGFHTTRDADGGTLLYPCGDLTAEPSAKMPAGGYFFDGLIRQQPIDDDRLDPADNLEEFTLVSDADLDDLECRARAARATGRAVVASFGGTSFGDIALVPGMSLRRPRGIRDVAEWYMSIRSRRDYVRRVFEGQCDIALRNLERIAGRVAPFVDVVNVCGTDFGTQTSSFCSVATFQELWTPVYRRVNDWIHRNTPWRTFKHSCGAVEKFIEPFIGCGFDILNPLQCSAAGMDPRHLEERYGGRIVLWGGGVDTQQTLPFGTPAQVRAEVLSRCETFARAGGFVFNTVHNIQAGTPVPNLVAMFEALNQARGIRHPC